MRHPPIVLLCLALWSSLAQSTAHNSGRAGAALPHLVVQVGHLSEINAVAYSPTGQMLASAGDEGTVRLWDARTGDLIRVLNGHRRRVTSLAFSPLGNLLATTSWHEGAHADVGDVSLWNPRTGGLLKALPGHRNLVMGVAFSRDGRVLATGGYDNTVKLWNARSGTLIRTIEASGEVYEVAFTPDSRRVAAAKADGVLIWDARTGVLVRRIGGHRYNVCPISFSPDGKLLVIGGGQEEARICHLRTGQCKPLFTGSETVSSIAFSPDGTLLACGGYYQSGGDGTVSLLDARTGRALWRMRRKGFTIKAVAFSPDGQTLACGGRSFGKLDGGQLVLISPRHGTIRHVLAPSCQPVHTTALAAKGAVLAAAHIAGTVSFWDARQGVLRKSIKTGSSYLTSISLSSDGKTMAANDGLDLVTVWDIQNARKLCSIKADPGWRPVATVSPDGKMLAVGYRMQHGTIMPAPSRVDRVSLVDTQTGKVRALLKLRSPGFASTAVFSPAEPIVATWGTEGPIELWDARNGAQQGVIPTTDKPVNAVSFAPDGRGIAVAVGEHTVGIWDGATRRFGGFIVLPGQPVKECAFSPDGRTLVCADGSSQVHLVDLATKKIQRPVRVPGGGVSSAAFLPHGKRLVISSADGGVTYWESATGRLLVTLRVFFPGNAHDLPTHWLSYTPDGYYTGSPQVSRFIRWRVGAKLLPADAYARAYRRPDVIREALDDGTGRPSAHSRSQWWAGNNSNPVR